MATAYGRVRKTDAASEAREVLHELSVWVGDLLASLSANAPSVQTVLLSHATFGARAELNAHDLLRVAADGRPVLTDLGQLVAQAATQHRLEHGPSPEWARSVAEADLWLGDS